MIRKLNVISLVFCVLALCSPAFAWKFASIADSRGDTNGVNVAELTKIVNKINAEGVSLVLFQGDAVNGGDSATVGSQMNTWLGVMNQLNCPWYWTPGNHEIGGSSANLAACVSRVNMPLNGPAGYEETAYSFDYGNAHFVALDSYHPGEDHHVQRTWLKSDLAANIKPHIFVMTHDPAYPAGPHVGGSLDAYPSERDDLWGIMGKAGVMMFFCGHEHLYQRSQRGNIIQVINGSCGAPLYSGVAGTTAAYQYVIVTIDGNKVHCETKYDTGVTFDTWDYTVAPDCGSAATIPNDTMNTLLAAKTVTKVRGNTFWVEDNNRAAACQASITPAPTVGDKLNIYGKFKTLTTGERELQGTAVTVSTYNTPAKPVAMTVKNLLGAAKGNIPGATGAVGLGNYGLLVRVAGKVTAVGTGANFGLFYLDDGSNIKDGTSWDGKENVGVRVQAGDSVTKGEMKTMTGVVSVFKNGSTLCRLLYCGEYTGPSSLLVAYNDCVYDVPQYKGTNTTTYNIGAGSPGPSSWALKDYVTGQLTSVTATLTQSGGVTWQAIPGFGGKDCNSGTDAYNTFGAKADMSGVIQYGAAGWYVDLELTGLKPTAKYEFATSANRDGATFLTRWTKYTISGADAFINTSTAGTTATSGGASVAFCTGYNTVNGYVARWTSINPGADGKIKIRAECEGASGHDATLAYAFDVFMVRELP